MTKFRVIAISVLVLYYSSFFTAFFLGLALQDPLAYPWALQPTGFFILLLVSLSGLLVWKLTRRVYNFWEWWHGSSVN